MRKIAELQITKLTERMKKQGVALRVDESAVELLAEKGYDPAFGARPLKRTIQSMLQNAVADRILDGKPGEHEELAAFADGEMIKVERKALVE